MITERELVRERPTTPRVSDPVRRVLQRGPQGATEPSEPGLVRRLLMVVIGFSLATLGWTLVMSVFLAFIGLPLFIFGLALMQAQEN